MDEETRLDTAVTTEDWENLPDDAALDDDSTVDLETTEADDTAENADLKDTDADQQLWTDGKTDTPETKPGQAEEADQFTLKHLDEVKTVSKDEVVVLAQKGLDYDRIRQKHEDLSAEQRALTALCPDPRQALTHLNTMARQQGFADVNALIDETRAALLAEREKLDLSVARGRIALEQKEQRLAEKESRLGAGRAFAETPAEAEKQAQEKRGSDFAEFIREYPTVTPEAVPKEVWALYSQGGRTLVQAYEKIENRQLKSLVASDRKNAENRQRSTGSTTSVGRSNPQDEFDKLWNSD